MILKHCRGLVVRIVSVALVCAGFAQVSFGGIVGTEYLVSAEARAASMERVSAFLARDDVASQLQALGVDTADIDERLAGLTDAELISLEGQIDRQVAGGDGVITVIGIVFLVLLILELVGVTDVFKSF